MRILLAVDGSNSAAQAVEALVVHTRALREKPEIDVVFVHLPVRPIGSVHGVAVSQESLERYYEQDAQEVLAPSLKRLAEAGLAYKTHLLIGDPAPQLCNFAREHRNDLVFMGTRGMSTIGNLFLGSTAQKVLHLCDIPVVLVPKRRDEAEPVYVGPTMRI